MDEQEYLRLKKKYWNLYYIEICDTEFLFREISRGEYRECLRIYENNEDQEDYICKLCVVEPTDYDWDRCPGGLPTTIASMILMESGFVEDTGKLAYYLDKYRKEMDTFDNQAPCIIHEAFPDIPLEEIDTWAMEKTIWYYTRAEYVLASLRNTPITIESATGNPKQQPEKRFRAEPVVEKNPEGGPLEYELEGESSSRSDFPELADIDAFMKGKIY